MARDFLEEIYDKLEAEIIANCVEPPPGEYSTPDERISYILEEYRREREREAEILAGLGASNYWACLP